MKKKEIKNKRDEIMSSIQTRLRDIVAFNLHWKLLNSDKKYFKSYCKITGINEYDMRRVLNRTYNGKLPKLMVMVQRAGLVVNITWIKNKEKK